MALAYNMIAKAGIHRKTMAIPVPNPQITTVLQATNTSSLPQSMASILAAHYAPHLKVFIEKQSAPLDLIDMFRALGDPFIAALRARVSHRSLFDLFRSRAPAEFSTKYRTFTRAVSEYRKICGLPPVYRLRKARKTLKDQSRNESSPASARPSIGQSKDLAPIIHPPVPQLASVSPPVSEVIPSQGTSNYWQSGQEISDELEQYRQRKLKMAIKDRLDGVVTKPLEDLRSEELERRLQAQH